MRIGIDVRYLSHGLVGGVHSYIASFLPELVALTGGHQLFLYADTKRPLELAELPGHVTVRYLPWRNPLSSVWNDFTVRRWMAADGVEVAHFPANCGFGPDGAATVITLHDHINILPLREIVRGHRKDPRTLAMITYLHFITVASLRRADLLLTVSAYAKAEIARHSHYPAARIVPIPHGRDPHFGRIDDALRLDEVRTRHGIQGPFVLADALKNPVVLVQAWTRLSETLRRDYRIVFFSRRPDPLPVVHEAVSRGDAQLLVNPSREDLNALYSMADAFVFPSWIEGFGMPVLEAMACGAPVIASDRPAIPEVAGDAALYADAKDADALARHICQVLTEPATAADLRERGYRRVAQFAWPKTAQAILDAYAQAANLRTSPHSVAVPVG